ncbi:MAG: glycosyltransferase family 2 protein [Variibacter sp.]
MLASSDHAGRTRTEPHVAILMATYNGARFLTEQLETIRAQVYSNWSLWASDDGSSDATLATMEAFREVCDTNRVSILNGPRQGFVRNFLSLACNTAIEADYFAFCDQDDIWLPGKLERAVALLEDAPANEPALYTGRTEIMTENGVVTGLSPLFTRKPDLRNALVQSIGGGNTIVFNRAARDLLLLAGADLDVPSHDWWCYLAVSACGGHVIYDSQSCLRYRQHSANIIGENMSLAARMMRVEILLRGRFSRWIEANLDALRRLRPAMPPSHTALVAQFEALRRKRSGFARVAGMRRLGLYRQTLLGSISLHVAALLGKW